MGLEVPIVEVMDNLQDQLTEIEAKAYSRGKSDAAEELHRKIGKMLGIHGL